MTEPRRSPTYARRAATPAALKLAAVPIVVAVIAGGVWFTGAVVSDDAKVAMGLTAVWLGIVFLACLLVVRARRDLLLPVLGTCLLVSAAIMGYLGYSSLVDREVDEEVAVGMPASRAEGAAPAAGGEPDAGGGAEAGGDAEAGGGAEAGNVQVASGSFTDLAHPTSGKAAIVRLAGGERVLTLTGFETDPGPDLRVYLATNDEASDFEDLGALKGNKGDQQYEIPDDVDVERLSTVLVWCRAFTVGFGAAELRPS